MDKESSFSLLVNVSHKEKKEISSLIFLCLTLNFKLQLVVGSHLWNYLIYLNIDGGLKLFNKIEKYIKLIFAKIRRISYIFHYILKFSQMTIETFILHDKNLFSNKISLTFRY